MTSLLRRTCVLALTFATFLASSALAACPNGGTVLLTADEVNTVLRNNPSGAFCLGADIDLSSIPNWISIGDTNAPFTGVLDGANHRVSNLTLSANSGAVGFFGVVRGGQISNLEFANVSIQVVVGGSNVYPQVGSLAGVVESGSVVGVRARGHISVSVVGQGSGSSTGGLIGTLGGRVAESSANVDLLVTGGTMGGGGVGGLVGTACCAKSAPNTVSASFATGTVTVRSVADDNFAAGVGGLVGLNGATVQDSYATGTVDSDTGTKVGGLVGFAAFDYGSISRSFATGSVIGGASSRVGGLVGWVYDVMVSQSYASGTVDGGVGSAVGGLVGQNGGGCFPCSASVSQSYAVGPVAADAGSRVGGLIGVNGTDGSVTVSVWDLQSSGRSDSAGGTGLTTAQLQSGALPTGFDPSAWSAAVGRYPLLLWHTSGTISASSNLSSATFTITGPVSYRGSGTSFAQGDVPAGTYTITYDPVNCYTTPPPQSLVLPSGGVIRFSQAIYLSAASLAINVMPLGAASASFAVSPTIPGISHTGPYPRLTDGVPPLTYTVTFGPVTGFSTPPPQTASPNSFCRIESIGVYTPTSVGTPGSVVLTVGRNGSGAGTVTSKPAGIMCGATCTASLASGTHIKLEAVAAAGSTFVGWNDSSCRGTVQPCAFQLTGNRSVTATFIESPTDSRNKIIYVGICGAGDLVDDSCLSNFGWYDPKDVFTWIDPLNETDLNSLGLEYSGLDAIGLRVKRLFPNSVTLVTGFSVANAVSETVLLRLIQNSAAQIVDFVSGVYRPGDQIFLVGHSAGGAIVQEVANSLKKYPIAMTAQIDSVGTLDSSIAANVQRAFNFYYPKSVLCPVWGLTEIVSQRKSATVVSNTRIDAPLGPASLASLCGGHKNMDNEPLVWRPILDFILGIP